METFEVWLKENREQLEKDYEFDINEAMRLKGTADYGNDNWEHIEPFGEYCRTRYDTDVEDEIEDEKAS